MDAEAIDDGLEPSNKLAPSIALLRWVAYWCVAWFICGLAARLYGSAFTFFLPFVMLLWAICLALVGLVALRHLLRAPVGALLTALTMPIAFFLLGPALSYGAAVTSLLIQRSSFETAIASTAPSSDGGRTSGGILYMVDAGPPRRYAFMTMPGFLDNWVGIVHDPTHQVALAQGFTSGGGYTAPAAVHELFGGDIIDCDHLFGDYYECSFT